MTKNWNRLFILLASILVAISLFSSCRQSEKPISPQRIEESSNPLPPKTDIINIIQVIGQKWILQAYGQIGSEEKIILKTEITLQFMADRISGSGGCNRYFSSYKETQGKLFIQPVASTKMFCAIPEGTMRQEQEYFKALQTVTKHHILDNEQTLQLLYNNSKNNLLFLKKRE